MKLWCCIAALLLAGFSGAQIHEKPFSPKAGEISKEKAISSCQQFCKKVSLPVPKDKPTINRKTRYSEQVVLYIVRFNDYTFYINGKDGVITQFTNGLRRWEISKGLARHKRDAIPDQATAKIALTSFANNIGMPDECKLDQILFDTYNIRGNGGTSLEANGLFVKFHKGYRNIGVLGGMRIVLDRQDGVILQYFRTEIPLVYEADSAKLSFEQAVEYAKKTTKLYHVGETRDSQAISGKSAEKSLLQYVQPNGQYKGLNYTSAKFPWRLRLAWVLKYSNGDQIWVDASDGRILGGVYIQAGGTHP